MGIMFDAELWYCEPRQISNHNNELLAFMKEGEKKQQQQQHRCIFIDVELLE